MLKNLKNKNAQTVAAEYALVFFVVVGMVSGMTMYFKRAVQARVRDAHNSVYYTIRNRVGTEYAGNRVYIQYEPYYRISNSLTDRAYSDTKQVLPSLPLSSGIFRKSLNQTTRSNSQTITLPPINADF